MWRGGTGWGEGGWSINPKILCNRCVAHVLIVVIRVYVTLICIQHVRNRLCQRKSISAQFPIHCHALYWSPYQKEILYRVIIRTKCVFIPRLLLKWKCSCNLVQLGLWAKDLLNWFSSWRSKELSLKLLLVSTKWQRRVSVEDLQILSIRMLWG